MSSKVWLVFYFEDLFILSKERLVSWILEVVSLKCVLFFKKKTKIIYREGFLEKVFFFFFASQTSIWNSWAKYGQEQHFCL